MKEAVLHYLFDSRKLGNEFVTTNGQKIEVINFGKLNSNAGPDFLEGQIKFDNKIWAGHIEFHLKSSDWFKHNHQFDPAYDNVIAHFVLEHDKEVKSGDFTLPVVELKSIVTAEDVKSYENFVNAKSWIPCEKMFSQVDPKIINLQLQAMSEKRIERKGNEVVQLLNSFSGDQQKTFLYLIAKTLGGKVNSEGFTKLINKIDVVLLARLNYESVKIQALFHGLSGLLPQKSDDEYVQTLIKEFEYQKKLFELSPLTKVEWKFSSMRPAGNPTFRIMQLAEIATKLAVSRPDQKTFIQELNQISFHNFWSTRYSFKSVSKKKQVNISNDLIDKIVINAIIPWSYMKTEVSGTQKSNSILMAELKALKPEKNQIISKWTKIGMKAKTAKDSQALIELKNELCNQKKCLICTIGKSLLYK